MFVSDHLRSYRPPCLNISSTKQNCFPAGKASGENISTKASEDPPPLIGPKLEDKFTVAVDGEVIVLDDVTKQVRVWSRRRKGHYTLFYCLNLIFLFAVMSIETSRATVATKKCNTTKREVSLDGVTQRSSREVGKQKYGYCGNMKILGFIFVDQGGIKVIVTEDVTKQVGLVERSSVVVLRCATLCSSKVRARITPCFVFPPPKNQGAASLLGWSHVGSQLLFLLVSLKRLAYGSCTINVA